MRNETISRMLGAVVGAAVIIATLAALGAGISSLHDSAAQPMAPVASLHASETVNVFSGN